MIEYLAHLLIFVAIFAILAVSVDILLGHTGVLSLAQGAFFGLGAYSYAIAVGQFRSSWIAGVILGMVLAATASLLLAIPSLRLKGDYFLLVTFAFQLIFTSLAINLERVTRGSRGITGIPRPTLLGYQLQSNSRFVMLAILEFGVILIVLARVSSSPLGRILHAIREDEILVASLGKSVVKVKMVAFSLSAALASVAGSIYAQYIGYIDPSSSGVFLSISALSMAIVGGLGRIAGPLAGASLLVVLPEFLRFVGVPGSYAANVRQILYGLLLVVVAMRRPRGLMD